MTRTSAPRRSAHLTPVTRRRRALAKIPTEIPAILVYSVRCTELSQRTAGLSGEDVGAGDVAGANGPRERAGTAIVVGRPAKPARADGVAVAQFEKVALDPVRTRSGRRDPAFRSIAQVIACSLTREQDCTPIPRRVKSQIDATIDADRACARSSQQWQQFRQNFRGMFHRNLSCLAQRKDVQFTAIHSAQEVRHGSRQIHQR